jgi:uroporphyrinogen III methyltransferase/synthase
MLCPAGLRDKMTDMPRPPEKSSPATRAHIPRRRSTVTRRTLGRVLIVGAGPGDPGLITLNGRRALARADVVYHDALVDQRLLDYCRRGARRVFVGRREGTRTFPQAELNRRLVEEASAGRTVVRLKGGDPFIFGRGGEEAQALVAAGVPFEVVPGVSAGTAVPAYAGIPLTHRAFTSELVFLTAHECAAGTSVPVDWARHAPGASTLVIFMGRERLASVTARLLDHGRDPECPVAVVFAGTTGRQRTIVAPLREIADRIASEGPDETALIVVGEVVRLREVLHWFEERADGA